MLEAGHAPINPARNFGGRTDLTRAEYMRLDLGMLLQAEGVLFLEGWEESSGASVEHAVASQLGLATFTPSLALRSGVLEAYKVEWTH